MVRSWASALGCVLLAVARARLDARNKTLAAVVDARQHHHRTTVVSQANYEKTVWAKTSRTNARGEGESSARWGSK